MSEIASLWQRLRTRFQRADDKAIVDAPLFGARGAAHSLQAAESLRALLDDPQIPASIRTQLAADFTRLESMLAKLERGELHVAVFGRVSVGKSALAERRAHPQRVLVGLELEGNEPSAHGECVHVGRQQVGVVTSGTRSPILKKNIALCRMNVQYAEPGTEVEVGKLDGFQKRIPATVVRFPFYDPEKLRPRS